MPAKETKSEVKKTKLPKQTKKKTASSTTKKATTKKSVSQSNKTKVSTASTKEKTATSSKKAVKTTSATKKTTKRTTKTKKDLKEVSEKTIQILEYYDLPYRYNETIVKILAQTPKVLFVYWDISDIDRENYIKQYGEYFFNDTYPVLIVHNKTKNYTSEIPINDFANSWYLEIDDPNCEYNIELGRRFKEYATRNPDIHIPENNYIYVSNSNNLVMPNDHILLEEIKPQIEYKNVKTGQTYTKSVSNILVKNEIKPLKNFHELYQNMYQVEKLDSSFFDLKNPGSSNPTSTFK